MGTTRTPVKIPDDLQQPGQERVPVLAAEGPVAEIASLRVVDERVDIAALATVGVATALTDLLRNVSPGAKPLTAVISRKYGGNASSEVGGTVSSESRQRVWRAACALCARLLDNTAESVSQRTIGTGFHRGCGWRERCARCAACVGCARS